MNMVIYGLVAFVVISDVFIAQYFNAKRKQLDLKDPEQAQRDRAYRFLIKMVLVYSFVVAVVLIVVVKPMMAQMAG